MYIFEGREGHIYIYILINLILSQVKEYSLYRHCFSDEDILPTP